ncbi:hypothetical protein HK101_004831 [Irineochytrium annulatum]|nr:hypothetical protein HK101_004831 [Irineochytrium annulatum]
MTLLSLPDSLAALSLHAHQAFHPPLPFMAKSIMPTPIQSPNVHIPTHNNSMHHPSLAGIHDHHDLIDDAPTPTAATPPRFKHGGSPWASADEEMDDDASYCHQSAATTRSCASSTSSVSSSSSIVSPQPPPPQFPPAPAPARYESPNPHLMGRRNSEQRGRFTVMWD